MGRAVPPIACPFCASDDVELVSPWGGQIITSQMRCRACSTYFEAIREEFDGVPDEIASPAAHSPEPGESGAIPHARPNRNGQIPSREFGPITPPAAHSPEPNSPWTTSSADDR